MTSKLGKNLQFLRKMYHGITQEELAEKLRVSRQTVSRWELDSAYPEIEKMIELCQLFSCSMDSLLQEDMSIFDECYSNIRVEETEGFHYVQYNVISEEPEDDSTRHVLKWARQRGVENPLIIGWDFPHVSVEQVNVYHMRGYAAAWILPEGFQWQDENISVKEQGKHTYAAITITDPFRAPFTVIPNAYKTLMAFMKINGLKHCKDKNVIACYERDYISGGVQYMDIYIAID